MEAVILMTGMMIVFAIFVAAFIFRTPAAAAPAVTVVPTILPTPTAVAATAPATTALPTLTPVVTGTPMPTVLPTVEPTLNPALYDYVRAQVKSNKCAAGGLVGAKCTAQVEYKYDKRTWAPTLEYPAGMADTNYFKLKDGDIVELPVLRKNPITCAPRCVGKVGTTSYKFTMR